MAQEQLAPHASLEAQMTGGQPYTAPMLDRPLLSTLQLSWETLTWACLLIAATALRLINLGVRAMSHDESLHALYSYYLYDSGKYEHNPMMHGPLLFHVNAFFYFLFGDNDTTARIFPALCGIGVVWMAYHFRRYIGRTGALFAGLLLTISPSLLFHSRYIRDDIYIAFFLLVWIYGAFRYLDTSQRRWLFAVALGMVFGILSMEAHFISGAILGGFFGALALWQVLQQRALPAFVPLILGGGIWYVLHERSKDLIKQAEAQADAVQKQSLQSSGDFYSLLGLVVLAVVALIALVLLWRAMNKSDWNHLRHNTSADLTVLMASLVLPFTAPFIHRVIGWDPMASGTTGDLMRSALLVGLMTVLSISLAWYWFGERPALAEGEERRPQLDLLTWAQLMGIFWVIAILFYTTFLTNIRNGLATGIVGSLGYWLAQQNVERGSQPWYYYIFIGWIYEFMPIILSGVGIVVIVRWLWLRPDWDPVPAAELSEDNIPTSDFRTPNFELLRQNRLYFAIFSAWWVIATWIGFTVAGEKMPWLLTHMAMPMCMVGGWYLGRLVHRIDWRSVWEEQAVWLIGATPALILVLTILLWGGPENGQSLTATAATLQWILGLAILAGLAYFIWRRSAGLGWLTTLRLLGLGVVVVLFLLTVRFSYMLTYINYDMATEYLVYAHASPDIKRALSEIDSISERTVGARNIVVAYDDESSWPLSWYMRLYPNAKFYGAAPNSDNMSAPVIIVGPKNFDKVHPYVVRDYVKRTYRLVWWPDMGYFNLTLADLWKAVSDPVQRERNWDIFFYRRYRDVDQNGVLGKERDLSQWPHRHEFEMWVRRDIAAQIWDLGVAPITTAASDNDALARAKEVDLNAVALYNTAYSDKPLLAPRAVAAGPDGERVIADSGNHRIVVLDRNGNFVRAFGSLCKLNENNAGCVDPDGDGPLAAGDGQFNEPWGIAVDKAGQIFVADTWNGRIEVFDKEGKFLRKWGYFNTTNGELGDANALFGPRGLAVDTEGNLLVADTGNKRIIRFKPDGSLLQQVGGGGVVGGRFEEPVGVTVASDGSVLVADTWNRRVQRLSPQLEFVSEMAVPSWDNHDIYMKPYLAVATNGDVYVTDPQYYRVFVYNANGEIKATFGNFGTDANRFGLPNGIAFDAATNTVLVADANNNRVMAFPPVP